MNDPYEQEYPTSLAPMRTVRAICQSIGDYMWQADAWLFDQSAALSQLQLIGEDTIMDQLDVPYMYVVMREFQDRHDVIRFILGELAGPDWSIPYPSKRRGMALRPLLRNYQRAALHTLRCHRSVIPPQQYAGLLRRLRRTQHATLEVHDILLHQRNLAARGRRTWPTPEENHAQIPTT